MFGVTYAEAKSADTPWWPPEAKVVMSPSDVREFSSDKKLIKFINRQFESPDILAGGAGTVSGNVLGADENSRERRLLRLKGHKVHGNVLRLELTIYRSAFIFMPIPLAVLLGLEGKVMTDGIHLAVDCRDKRQVYGIQHLDRYRLMPTTISVHANFILPSVAGSVMSQILAVVPVLENGDQDNDATAFVPKHLQYFRLGNADLTDMQFTLLNSSGDELEFKDGEDRNVLIQIMLRVQRRG